MRVFVIIVVYNGMKWLGRCLESLRSSDMPVEVVAVDNASTDGSVQFIENNYPQVHLIRSNNNLGFGAANNRGIKHALDQQADCVFLLNQDAWVEQGTIRKLVNIHRAHQDFGIISPVHLNGAGDALDKNFQWYVNQFADKYCSDLVLGTVQDIYECSFVNAAAWLIPTATLQKIGGFDPLFYHYGEDENYCQRIYYHGKKIGFVPEAKICHDRENRPVQQEKFDPGKMWRQIMVQLANVNEKPSSSFSRLFKRVSKLFCVYAIRLNFKAAFSCLTILVRMLRSRSAISKSIVNNQKGGCYLE